jgi:hypothetical protein
VPHEKLCANFSLASGILFGKASGKIYKFIFGFLIKFCNFAIYASKASKFKKLNFVAQVSKIRT